MNGTSIYVEVYPTKIRIINPGGLPSTISESDLGTKIISSRRNNLIADLFNRIEVVERVGTGLMRLQQQLKLAGLKPAQFNSIENPHFFEIEIERPAAYRSVQNTAKTTQKTTQKILALLQSNPKMSRRAIAQALGDITEDGIKYHLAQMQREGLIRRVGPDKGGHWEIQ